MTSVRLERELVPAYCFLPEDGELWMPLSGGSVDFMRREGF